MGASDDERKSQIFSKRLEMRILRRFGIKKGGMRSMRYEKYSDISIPHSLSLIRLANDPDDSIFGVCLTFEKL